MNLSRCCCEYLQILIPGRVFAILSILMDPQNQREIEGRVRSAAQAALDHHHYVSAIDVLTGMSWLTPASVEDWRRGRVPYLEKVVGTNLNRLSFAMKYFRKWASSQGLTPSETVYRRWGKGPKQLLRFSKSGAPLFEKYYSTHYVSRRAEARKDVIQQEPLNLNGTSKSTVD